MELIERLEDSLFMMASLLKLLLEALSVLFIALGLIRTIRMRITLNQRFRPTPSTKMRIVFGTWLSLALEFQLGADILATTISPSSEALVKLAIIAIIRTFLNYFLNKELESETEVERQSEKAMSPTQLEET